MSIDTNKREQILASGLSPAVLDELEGLNTALETQGKGLELERKEEAVEEDVVATAEETETDTEEVVEPEAEAKETPEQETEEEVVDDNPITREEIAEAIKEGVLAGNEHILGELAAIKNQVKELSETDEEKIAKQVDEIPTASISQLVTDRLVGKDAARVDGRTSLANSAPEETEYTEDAIPGSLGIGLINDIKSGKFDNKPVQTR